MMRNTDWTPKEVSEQLEEAARTLNVPVTTLRNHLHRGMAKLRSLLEQP